VNTEQSLSQRTILGTPGAGGRNIGRPEVLLTEKTVVRPQTISESDVEKELELTENGIDALIEEFEHLKQVSDESDVKEIIESQIQVARDPELDKRIRDNITEKKYSSVYAVFSSFNDYINILENSDTTWLNERSIDIVSIRDQLIDIIRNRQPDDYNADDAVIFATELSPTEMIKLSHYNLAGIITEKGGLTSHVVILAQSLGIPCVIGVEWKKMRPQRFDSVLIDGDVGSVLFDPTDELVEEFEQYLEKQRRREQTALEWASKPSKTRCGSPFTIRGNIEFASELPRLATHGAKGVGLLRTETILFETNNFDVRAQVQFYQQVADASSGEPVVIRLFDAGGDKLPDNHDKEDNPFLGWRGIRMLLDKPDLLRQQFEAILRTSAKHPGKIRILVPMISHIREIVETKEILEELKEDLRQQNVEFDETIPFGIMIEVPGIAVMAREAAKKVDFFSIGTNDLTQYMLAVDRGNSKISKLYQPLHPSIWKMMKSVIDASKNAGMPISVCGEMASNPLFAACFLGMGLSDLSMTTSSIPSVKSLLCRHDLSRFKVLANDVLSAETCKDVENVFRSREQLFLKDRE